MSSPMIAQAEAMPQTVAPDSAAPTAAPDSAAAVAADTTTSTADAVRTKVGGLTELVSVADIVAVLLVLVATHYLIRLLSAVAEILAERLPRQRLLLMQLVPVARISLWLLAFYVVVVGIFSPSRESLLAFAATAGIGIGFAAQDVLKNIFGGIVIVVDRPFQLGDLVDIGDYHGEIVGIGLRATRIRTLDDSIVSVPNAEVVSQPVSNANTGALDCMVVVELLLPAMVDPIRVRRICHEAAATSPYLYAAKPISVRISDEFRETFLTKVKIKAYVYDHRLETAFSTDVTSRAKRGLARARLLPDEMVFGPDPAETRRYLLESGAGAARAGES